MERSAALQLLESFPDQLLKLLRLRGERLHLVLSKLRLKRQNFLKVLCLGDFSDQGESRVGILRRHRDGTFLYILEASDVEVSDHGISGHRVHPGAHGFVHEICELLKVMCVFFACHNIIFCCSKRNIFRI